MRWPVALAFAPDAAPVSGVTVTGSVEVIDGDTLEMDGRRMRLFGIDAPGHSQGCDRNGRTRACGISSAERMRGAIGGDPASCTGEKIDAHGRQVAACTIAGADFGPQLVAEGWATAFRRYSHDYVAEDLQAQAGRAGLWASTFTPPGDFRGTANEAATTRSPGTQAPRAAPCGCTIKGARSRHGDWIYPLSCMSYHEETRPQVMFCSEAEAQAAGYRRSRAR